MVNYSNFTYNLQSTNVNLSLIKNLLIRGFDIKLIHFQVQTNSKIDHFKVDSSEISQLISYLTNINSSVRGNSIMIMRKIEVDVGNITNEYINWSVNFSISIDGKLIPTFNEGKLQNKKRESRIKLVVDRYKNLFLSLFNDYASTSLALLSAKETEGIVEDSNRYVDRYYVIDEFGADDTYVYP